MVPSVKMALILLLFVALGGCASPERTPYRVLHVPEHMIVVDPDFEGLGHYLPATPVRPAVIILRQLPNDDPLTWEIAGHEVGHLLHDVAGLPHPYE